MDIKILVLFIYLITQFVVNEAEILRGKYVHKRKPRQYRQISHAEIYSPEIAETVCLKSNCEADQEVCFQDEDCCSFHCENNHCSQYEPKITADCKTPDMSSDYQNKIKIDCNIERDGNRQPVYVNEFHCVDSKWTGKDPSVFIKEFGNIQSSNKSQLFAVTESYVRYSCIDDTYLMVGQEVSTCLENGTWSSKQPVCQTNICREQADSLPTLLLILMSSSKESSKLLTIISITFIVFGLLVSFISIVSIVFSLKRAKKSQYIKQLINERKLNQTLISNDGDLNSLPINGSEQFDNYSNKTVYQFELHDKPAITGTKSVYDRLYPVI